ncbi:hypothetical protein Tco_0435773 [Tanacetum coccineum]
MLHSIDKLEDVQQDWIQRISSLKDFNKKREQFTIDEQARMLIIRWLKTVTRMMVSQKQPESSKKRPRAEHDEESVKKQKLEDEAEREELRACLDIVPGDDIAMDFESLATKYLIIDWKTHILIENMMYYQSIRADRSFKNYKIFSKMLDDFDRQDVINLYRLVKERYETTSLKGYDLLLWGDLKNLLEPSEEVKYMEINSLQLDKLEII